MEPTTKVVYLIDDEHTVFALFPYEYYNYEVDPDMVWCYQHQGQHSACSLTYSSCCVYATEDEYRPLERELLSIGYNLELDEHFYPVMGSFDDIGDII